MTPEQWRTIPGYEGCYLISDTGRVFSFRSGKTLRPARNPDGYLTVCLCADGKRNTKKVHRLVGENFLEGRSSLHNEIGHLDGDRTNPRLGNLKWVSRGENFSHRQEHGTHPSGERHPRAVLTEAAVSNIKAALAGGAGNLALGKNYGVTAGAIQNIKRGRTWKHVAPALGFNRGERKEVE